MSASVASKNLYELLGNDPPEDDTPKKAPRVVVKSTNTTKKQDEKPQPAGATPGGFRGGRSNRYTGNEGAFRDREAGRDNNRNRNVESGGAPIRGGRGRGGRTGRREFDRHSATGRDEHEKQVNHGWGAPEGNSEWQDELAGAALAQKDAEGADPADPNAAAPDADPEAAAEEEGPKTKTYDEYLAELAQRQAELGPRSDVRKPNEGAQDSKWANAKPFTKEESEYITGGNKDKSRNRERKQKQLVDIDMRYSEPSRGGRGDRGGRGRAGDRGGRGGRGGERGAHRGGEHRGGRGGRTAPPVNLTDDKAFPSLGGN